jgi:hypothetical protein
MNALGLISAFAAGAAYAQIPSRPATWVLNRSTIIM